MTEGERWRGSWDESVFFSLKKEFFFFTANGKKRSMGFATDRSPLRHDGREKQSLQKKNNNAK